MLPTNPQIQIEAAIIARLLTELPIDAVLSYAAASEAIGRDVCREACFSLMKARKMAEQETGTIYATVRKVGVRRISGAHAAGVGAEARKRIGRAANRGYQRLTGLRYNDIDQASRQRIDAERSLLGAISSLASAASVKKAEALTSTGPVPAAKIMEALK